MSLIAKIAKNTLYQTVGKGIGTVLGVITIALITRQLGPTGFGYYTTSITFLQFFSVLIDFGLQMTTSQMLAKPGANEKKIFANIFTIRLLSSIILLGGAAALIWLLPYPTIIKQGAGIASFSFLFIALQSVLISIFQKNLDSGKIAASEVFSRLALLIGVVISMYFGGGVLPIIASVSVGSLVGFLILFFGAKKHLPIGLEFDKKVWKEIWTISWPLTITIALTLVYFRADTVVMSLTRPQNEVGLYGATYKVLEIIIQFSYLFLGLILPLLTKFYVESLDLFNKAIQKTYDFYAILIIPMIGATIILAEKIMVFVSGNDFAASGSILRILVLAVGMIFLNSLFGYGIVAGNQQKKMIKFYLANAVVILALYLILIPIYTYWAAAWLTVASETIMAVSAFYIIRKQSGLRLKNNIVSKSALASLIMMAVLYFINSQNLATQVIVGLIIYFWALYMFKGIDKKIIKDIMPNKNLLN